MFYDVQNHYDIFKVNLKNRLQIENKTIWFENKGAKLSVKKFVQGNVATIPISVAEQ